MRLKRKLHNVLFITLVSVFLVGYTGEEFSRKTLYNYILECRIKSPKIVYAQAILETGSFKSRLFNTHNNLFGFRGSQGYICYNNWRESVDHYSRWQEENYKGGDYYAFLTKIHYAEDSSYVSKLKRITIPF